MKFPWTISVLASFCLLATNPIAKANPDRLSNLSATSKVTTPVNTLEERINTLDLPFQPKITPTVREYVRRYTVNGYKDAELILGRTSMYFSIFEHYLSLYRLPSALKYLPMVESALIADVKSHAGAAGLWQFVPISARHFRLEMSSNVDERLDPYRSTEAAVKLLAMLYDELGNWPLALAAYNCGLGRVQQAVKRSGCDNYWDIQAYLPYDTRRYVPAFIAAAYVANYYQEHGLNPRYPSIDLQDTRAFRVYNGLSFSKLSKATGVSYSTLSALNPGFIKKYIPTSRKGHLLRVPASYAQQVREYLDQQQEVTLRMPEGRFQSFYVVTPGDRIETLASLFQCKVEDLMAWNGLAHPEVVVNQHLRIYLPKVVKTVRT